MTQTTAYIHFWSNRRDGAKDSFLTRAVPVKSKLVPHRATQAAEATNWLVLVDGRWRRVWQSYSWPNSRFIGTGSDNTVQITEGE